MDKVYLVIIDYNVVLETTDEGWALDFFNERSEEYKDINISVRLYEATERSSGK